MFGLPNITGSLSTNGWFEDGLGDATGAFYEGAATTYSGRGGGSATRVISFYASRSSSLFGASNAVQTSAALALAIIRT